MTATAQSDHDADVFAKTLNCRKGEAEPDLDMAVTAMSNDMIFQEDSYLAPQIKLIKEAIEKLACFSANAG